MKIALKLSTLVGVLLLASAAHAQTPAGDAKPTEPKPNDTKPDKAKPAPTKPSDVKAGAAKPTEAKPGEAKPAAPGAAPAAADTGAPAADEAEEPPPAQPQPAQPAPALPPPAPGTTAAGVGAAPIFPEPSADANALKQQGAERPGARAGEKDAGVFAEDWWSHARPVLELHGYFRVRGEWFHHFSLGRVDTPAEALWPRPADDSYKTPNAMRWGPSLCTPDEVDRGTADAFKDATNPCKNGTQAGANMRFRLNPELHISDNLRVLSQIDMLDNVVFGSTPGGYANLPAAGGGYAVADRNGYSAIGFYDDTAVPPESARNSLHDSILVKRAWAEYSTPVGEVRFGRMPNHWGLGMLLNSGDGYDDDYQSTIDRAQLIFGLKPLELYLSVAMDFPNDGATSDSVSLPNPQPYDLAQLDDVDQYTFSVARKKNPELERLALTKGNLVLNGGAMLIYRQQELANDRTGTTGPCAVGQATLGSPSSGLGCEPGHLAFTRRGAHAWTPDLWLELKYKRFRFGAEAVTVQGTIDNLESTSGADGPYDINEWGLATEIEQKLAEDKLKLLFKFGWASGDADVATLTPGPQLGDHTISTFRFHPSYDVDLILYRNILTRVQGTYYFRPSVDYDFSRDPNGQRIGGGLTVIWSRASQFIQTPGHARDLGIELNARLYFQSKDGALNDLPDQMGGFFAMLQYGVLFPMSGLGYPDNRAAEINSQLRAGAADTNVAQALRLYLGVFF